MDDTAVARAVASGGVRARVAPGVLLGAVIAGDGDADHLLTRPECRIVKLQRKVIVGRIATAAGTLYVKRYNVFAWRVALASLWGESPAFRAWRAAGTLTARGFATPELVAAIEVRRAGVLRRSFFVTREVGGALTADARWEAILADPDRDARRAARRALARALGELFRGLHAEGLYHNDLKDVNVLVTDPPAAPRCILLDLERVRVLRRVGRRRRVKNLVQLARTLGPRATAADRLRFLHAYLGPGARRGERRAWVDAVGRRARAKDRRAGRAGPPAGAIAPRLSCTVVCQDEERAIGPCLESVAWCDETVVVDGGSRDATLDLARRFTDRVLVNPWPGYRLQKQHALEAARGEWVLHLDADERVTPDLATEIRAALARVPPEIAGFVMPRIVCYLGRWWWRGGLWPRPVLRLMRRSAARWGGRDPHDRAEVTGRVAPLRGYLLHYTYDDVSDHLRSVNRLTRAAAAATRPRPVGIGRLVVAPAWRFVRAYLVRRGALDGLPGLFEAATSAFYVFLRWAKVREAGRASPGGRVPASASTGGRHSLDPRRPGT
jgi:hypothetical protein